MTINDDRSPAANPARSAAISVTWNYAGSVVSALLQLGYTAYTGRAVAASTFGIYAIALTTGQFLVLIANSGLSACLLRVEQLTTHTVRAARRLATASGVACFALVELAAPVLAELWRMPALTATLQLLGCQFLFQPAGAVAVAVLRRCGRQRIAVAAELSGQLVGMAVGAGLLAWGWNPLGLAAAQPAAAVLTLLTGTFCVAPLRLPGGPPVKVRELLASTGFLTSYSLVQFTINSTPMWVAGRLLGPAAAGAYSRASLLTGLPLTFLAQGLSKTAMPMLAERRGKDLSLNRSLEHVLCAASAAGFIGFGALAGIGPAALAVLLGPGWGSAATLVPVLAAAAAVTLVCSAVGSADQARHASRAIMGTQFAVVATTTVGVAVAATMHSLLLLAVAAAAGQVMGHIVQLTRWHHAGLLDGGVAVRIHVIHAAIGTALGGAGAVGGIGRSPVSALACGLACMVPVILGCVPLRARLPLYEMALAVRLQRS